MFKKTKTKNMKPKSKQYSINNTKVIEKVILMCISIIVMAAVMAPVIITLSYGASVKILYTSITEGEFLGYIGSIISSFVAILIALLSLLQSKKNAEIEERIQQKLRRLQIKPYLVVNIFKQNDVYTLCICNNSPNIAFDIYLFEYPIANLIRSMETVTITFTFADKNADVNVLCINPSYSEYEEKSELPKYIVLIYGDADSNCISDTYILSNGSYLSEKHEYC